ncbi:hydroxymethylglutaryl-CoA synthase [Aspergillus saccharolyticus JOP 1030-1]|uniref:Hydroxymethylglutaryl-CoA synthase n=1 Tax=Aspergillus saccharolyticus JOP 1030-1 TaxID=1450539 RepID=A0A318ZGQ3_9EURO|nr:hydroxymethylglutaryl-CoA synthase [Aspergillus saccharolyticus JOP 1030-1]PYH42840.1 hydroxymethylglutaryl-CoA synthase [Aspergillus saccharolyticus JOP 1030-1]
MQLFHPSNPDIEGVDTSNACYGGTAALFAAVAWLESSAWDGRDAIVVCGDIAAYRREDAAARPTGGAGCVAMLIGAEAPVCLAGPRASYMRHAWDFFKADFAREGPFVDGPGSGRCYLEAVDACYRSWCEKVLREEGEEEGAEQSGPGTGGRQVGIDAFDYFLFHAPNCKQVAKAYARLLWNDLLRAGESILPPELRGLVDGDRKVDDESTRANKPLEKALMQLTQARFEQRVRPGLLLPAQCGNMYTASLYSGLASLLASVPSEQLQGKRIGMFSYGSGLASSLFTVTIRGDTSGMAQRLDLHRRLAARVSVEPEVWDEMSRLREGAYQQKDYVPKGEVEALLPGTYYLKYVDAVFRREYEVRV